MIVKQEGIKRFFKLSLEIGFLSIDFDSLVLDNQKKGEEKICFYLRIIIGMYYVLNISLIEKVGLAWKTFLPNIFVFSKILFEVYETDLKSEKNLKALENNIRRRLKIFEGMTNFNVFENSNVEQKIEGGEVVSNEEETMEDNNIYN